MLMHSFGSLLLLLLLLLLSAAGTRGIGLEVKFGVKIMHMYMTLLQLLARCNEPAHELLTRSASKSAGTAQVSLNQPARCPSQTRGYVLLKLPSCSLSRSCCSKATQW
jgi:hypothetical protein